VVFNDGLRARREARAEGRPYVSDGRKVTAPKFLRQAARKLKRLRQALSRKTKGSNRRKKAVVKVARAHQPQDAVECAVVDVPVWCAP
jgi:hypothetical protein